MASTWKKLVQSLYIGLTGREWIIKTNGFLALTFLVIIGPILEWISESGRALRMLWDVWPWILAVLVCLKMAVAVWIAMRLYRSRLLSDRTLVTGAACWLAAVLALYGVLVWWIDTPLIPHYLARAVRDSRDPARAAVRRAAGARLESAPMTMKSREWSSLRCWF